MVFKYPVVHLHRIFIPSCLPEDLSGLPPNVHTQDADLSFQEIDEGTIELGGVQFEALSSLHPGRSLLYCLRHEGKRVIYATDNELPLGWKAGGGAAAHELERFIRFFADADLLIHADWIARETLAVSVDADGPELAIAKA